MHVYNSHRYICGKYYGMITSNLMRWNWLPVALMTVNTEVHAKCLFILAISLVLYFLVMYLIVQKQCELYLPPATKLWEGNVTTPVCHSVHQGSLCLGRSLSRGLCKGGYLSEGLCLGGLCPGGGLCSRGFSVQGGSLYSVRETLLYGNVWVICIQLECILVTIRKQSCRKVMFLHLSVSHSVHGGGSASVHSGIHPPAQCMLGYTVPSACWDRHASCWYASYWNAFLLFMI